MYPCSIFRSWFSGPKTQSTFAALMRFELATDCALTAPCDHHQLTVFSAHGSIGFSFYLIRGGVRSFVLHRHSLTTLAKSTN